LVEFERNARIIFGRVAVLRFRNASSKRDKDEKLTHDIKFDGNVWSLGCQKKKKILPQTDDQTKLQVKSEWFALQP
jgi:hypothetical protein